MGVLHGWRRARSTRQRCLRREASAHVAAPRYGQRRLEGGGPCAQPGRGGTRAHAVNTERVVRVRNLKCDRGGAIEEQALVAKHGSTEQMRPGMV